MGLLSDTRSFPHDSSPRRRAGEVDRETVSRLLPELYEELREVASGFLREERPDHTLQPTALVHETYLRLTKQKTIGFEGRLQFLGVAALLMRRILVDHARRKKASKRTIPETHVPLDETVAGFESRACDLLALDEALRRLSRWDLRKSRIVELRFFGGLSVRETASVLKVPVRTVEKEWTLARAWLKSEVF